MGKIIYKGFFTDERSSYLLKEKEGNKALGKDSLNKHVTFGFYPKAEFPDNIMNKMYTFMVIAQGYDQHNSGFQVLIPDELIPYYEGKPVAHLTTSVSLEGAPKNTALLAFKPIEPFTITGQMGYLIGCKGVILENEEGVES